MRTDEPLEGLCSVYAKPSLCELLDDFIEEQHLVSRTAAQALAVALGPTRWTINGGKNYVEDLQARDVWGRWNADRTAKAHSFGAVSFSDITDPARLLVLTKRALAEAVQPKVSYEIDVAELDF